MTHAQPEGLHIGQVNIATGRHDVDGSLMASFRRAAGVINGLAGRTESLSGAVAERRQGALRGYGAVTPPGHRSGEYGDGYARA